MEKKDNKVFWLLAVLCALVMLYIFAITFIGIPKENVRFADTSQGFFLGTILGSIIAYYVGGTAPIAKKKEDSQPGTTTADISATVTTVNDKQT